MKISSIFVAFLENTNFMCVEPIIHFWKKYLENGSKDMYLNMCQWKVHRLSHLALERNTLNHWGNIWKLKKLRYRKTSLSTQSLSNAYGFLLNLYASWQSLLQMTILNQSHNDTSTLLNNDYFLFLDILLSHGAVTLQTMENQESIVEYIQWLYILRDHSFKTSHSGFLEHWNSQKSLCNIWQYFSCQICRRIVLKNCRL